MKSKSPTKIKTELRSIYSNVSCLFSMITNCAAEFKHGHMSIYDNECLDCSKTVTTEQIGDKMHYIMLDDHWLTLLEIAEHASISSEHVHTILHKQLGMRKLTARWCHVCWQSIKSTIDWRCHKSMLSCIGAILAALCNHQWNLDLPSYTQDETTANALDCHTGTSFKEGKNHSICRKGDGNSFFGIATG